MVINPVASAMISAEWLLLSWMMFAVKISSIASNTDCPVQCVCKFDRKDSSLDLQCEGDTDLDHFFSDHADHIIHLYYHDSRLQAISPALCQLRLLTSLDLSSNAIRNNTSGSLACLKDLTSLNLNFNEIEYLDENSFAGLSRLQ